jgi:hypothetical protein
MIRIYRPLLVLRIISLLMFLFNVAILSGLLILFYRSSRPNLFPIFVVCLLLGYMFFYCYQETRIRLELSDSGIKYFSGYYTINTSWENVERVSQRVFAVGRRLPVEGLILRHPSATETNFTAKVLSSNFMGLFSSDRMAYEVDYSRSIPLQGIWSWNWRKSELAEDIRHYLPDLFGGQR